MSELQVSWATFSKIVFAY